MQEESKKGRNKQVFDPKGSRVVAGVVPIYKTKSYSFLCFSPR
jgi:hypothetical protein